MAGETLETEIGLGADLRTTKAMEHRVVADGRLHGDRGWRIGVVRMFGRWD